MRVKQPTSAFGLTNSLPQYVKHLGHAAIGVAVYTVSEDILGWNGVHVTLAFRAAIMLDRINRSDFPNWRLIETELYDIHQTMCYPIVRRALRTSIWLGIAAGVGYCLIPYYLYVPRDVRF